MIDRAKNDSITDTSQPNELQRNSLKIAGYSHLLANVALYVSGKMSGRKGEGYAGLTWLAGGLTAARYGNPKAETQLKILNQRLSSYLKENKIAIPNCPDTAMLTQEGGLIDHIEAFLYKYPSHILNITSAIGGGMLLHSHPDDKTFNKSSGALIVAGALAGLLIPEKKPDPDHPAHGFMAKAKEWVQEKPLRISGWMYAANNGLFGIDAFREMRAAPAQKSYLFKFLAVASSIFGNVMFSTSSKKQDGKGDHAEAAKALEQLGNEAAAVIAFQPAPVQEALLENIAGYLSAQREVKQSPLEIAELLHDKLAKVRQKLEASGKWQNYLQTGSRPSFSPCV